MINVKQMMQLNYLQAIEPQPPQQTQTCCDKNKDPTLLEFGMNFVKRNVTRTRIRTHVRILAAYPPWRGLA